MSRSICLTGMMGAGKSTVGRALGERLGRRLVDSDTEIERWTGSTIAEIFDEQGEEGFRALEHQVVRELGNYTDLVVALGGGVITRETNVEALRLTSVIIHLDVGADDLAVRLRDDRGRRPLLADTTDFDSLRTRLRQLYEERRQQYHHVADVRVNAAQPIADVVDSIVAWAMAQGDVLTPSEHEQVMT